MRIERVTNLAAIRHPAVFLATAIPLGVVALAWFVASWVDYVREEHPPHIWAIAGMLVSVVVPVIAVGILLVWSIGTNATP